MSDRKRYETAAGHQEDDDPSRIYTRQVDAANLRELKHIITREGFPTISMVGVDGIATPLVWSPLQTILA